MPFNLRSSGAGGGWDGHLARLQTVTPKPSLEFGCDVSSLATCPLWALAVRLVLHPCTCILIVMTFSVFTGEGVVALLDVA
jgi:hypothetical protein